METNEILRGNGRGVSPLVRDFVLIGQRVSHFGINLREYVKSIPINSPTRSTDSKYVRNGLTFAVIAKAKTSSVM